MKNTEQKMRNNMWAWGLRSLIAANLFSFKTFTNNDEILKLQFLLEQRQFLKVKVPSSCSQFLSAIFLSFKLHLPTAF
jgi:hypothetical protein